MVSFYVIEVVVVKISLASLNEECSSVLAWQCYEVCSYEIRKLRPKIFVPSLGEATHVVSDVEANMMVMQ